VLFFIICGAFFVIFDVHLVAELEAPLFWVKKKEMTEGRKANRGSKTKVGPPLIYN